MTNGLRRISDRIRRSVERITKRPFNSGDYWERRYMDGGDSGPGSYRRLAKFKAAVLNEFVAREGVRSIIEFGCGDGNQLQLARYPKYIGYDVSRTAVEMCRNAFASDESKQFHLISEYDRRQAELALSLDVIFHLVEDDVFERYMATLFHSASRFVAIYSSDTEERVVARHVRHRKFSRWIARSQPGWRLMAHIPNPYPYDGDNTSTSFADFHFYQRS